MRMQTMAAKEDAALPVEAGKAPVTVNVAGTVQLLKWRHRARATSADTGLVSTVDDTARHSRGKSSRRRAERNSFACAGDPCLVRRGHAGRNLQLGSRSAGAAGA